jgi:hypothetical protein
LIDWEAIGRGLGAFDVKHMILNGPRICDASQPCPDFCLSDELPDYYFDRCVSAGGTGVTPDSWPKVYELSSIATLMEGLLMGAGILELVISLAVGHPPGISFWPREDNSC